MNALRVLAVALDSIELDRRKRVAHTVVAKIARDRSLRLPIWWQWTPYLAAAITIRRIDAATQL